MTTIHSEKFNGNFPKTVEVKKLKGGGITLKVSCPTDRYFEIPRANISDDAAKALRDALIEAYPLVPPTPPAVDNVVALPKRRPTKGKQQYRGNGNHEWEAVANGTTKRLRVPGGWLYRFLGTESDTMTFVPVPDVVGYAV
jgi:hypothetical protein